MILQLLLTYILAIFYTRQTLIKLNFCFTVTSPAPRCEALSDVPHLYDYDQLSLSAAGLSRIILVLG